METLLCNLNVKCYHIETYIRTESYTTRTLSINWLRCVPELSVRYPANPQYQYVNKNVPQMGEERLAINDKPIFHMWLFSRLPEFFCGREPHLAELFRPRFFAFAVLFFRRRLFRHVLHAPRVTRTRFQRLYINNFIKSYVTGVVTTGVVDHVSRLLLISPPSPRLRVYFTCETDHSRELGQYFRGKGNNVGGFFFWLGRFFRERKTARSTESGFAFAAACLCVFFLCIAIFAYV